MSPFTKAKEILEKINNGKISKALWNNCSDFAKKDLKRKALIVVDEIISENKLFPYNTIFYERINFWQDVKKVINSF